MTSETAARVLDPGLATLLAAYDAAFAADRADAVAELFADDGRLQWPDEEDIVGRGAIRQAFAEFVDTFHTVSWQPTYQVAEVHDDRAFLLGRFVELREVRRTGELERVPGRLVLVCRRETDGAWRITHAMTSRYGEMTVEAPA
jgi:ketosteroid isomerase-like protein